MKKKGKQKFSLNSRIIGMIVLCWLVPITLTIGVAAVYIFGSQFRGKFAEQAKQLEFDMRICAERLSNMSTSAEKTAYEGDIETVYQKYQKGELKQKELVNQAQLYLADKYAHDIGIRETILWFYESPRTMNCHVYNRNIGGDYFEVNTYWTRDHSGVYQYACSMKNAVGFYEQNGRIYMFKNLIDRSTDEPMAVLVMRINSNYYFDDFVKSGEKSSVNIRLNDCFFVLAGEKLSDEELEICEQIDAEEGYKWVSGKVYLYKTIQVGTYDMQVFICQDNAQNRIAFWGYWIIIVAMTVFMVVLMVMCIRIIRKHVMVPISQMIQGAHKIEGGELGYQVDEEPASREFYYLVNTFNQMSAKIEEQFQHIHEEEEALQDARIMALQSHINPHFINNTLEIINWEARLNGNEKVSKMIRALSTLIDASVNRKKENEISLEEELEYVNAYLYIISVRFGNRISVINELPEDIMKCKVPRLILQPIIENAIEHGVAKKKKGIVRLCGRREGGYLYIDVINDAADKLDEEKIETLLDVNMDIKSEYMQNMGIANVNQRLHLLYGEPCGLQIYDMGEDKTCAHMTIRIEKEKRLDVQSSTH